MAGNVRVCDVAGIGAKIFGRGELLRIHEDRDRDRVGTLPGLFHQRKMSVMQGAHGGDKRQRFGPAAQIRNSFA